jgi:asparagine synthase (glutamine-hydrolysing)
MSLSGVPEVHEFPCGHDNTPEAGFVQYYDVPQPKNYHLTDVDHASRLIRRTVEHAVRKRLLADKKIHVGAFCSGGLDSSLVAAIAAKEIPHLHTFAVGMKDDTGKDSDDLIAGRIAAEHIGSIHHEYIITESDYYDALPGVIKKLETYDPSLVRCAVPCYFTCKLAAEYVTVVLTGEGADELFAGYHYMKRYPWDEVNAEARRLVAGVHNINLQRADRMGMMFSLELRVPFFDTDMIDLCMKISPSLKIREVDGKIEKWILRKAFESTGYLPGDILWRYKLQYTQGAGCEQLGERLAESLLTDDDFERIQAQNPNAIINSKEAAYYYEIFREHHPQDSVIKSIGIWSGFDFAEERVQKSGTIAI